MNESVGHVRCAHCRAQIPLRWAKDKINGMRMIGDAAFCGNQCEDNFASANALMRTGREDLFRIGLRKLQLGV